MSRCLTLEKYLEEFVDENTQSDAEEVKLIVTDQQAQTLGYVLINGLAGFVGHCATQQLSQITLDAKFACSGSVQRFVERRPRPRISARSFQN
jgi:hypothetical protein